MPRWSRSKTSYLVKTRKMSDGEMLHLLLGVTPGRIRKLDERLYKVLQDVKKTSGKVLLWMLGASAFAILSHFKVLKGFSAGGLDVAPVIFSHVALVAMSVSSAAFCFSFTKQSYLQSWFAWKLKSGTPARKAELLLRFPDAFWHFAYMPGAIGYPPYILAKRSDWPQLTSLLLLLLAIIIFSVGSLALWIEVAMDVWNAAHVGRAVSVMTIALSLTLVVLGGTAPFSYDIGRLYRHHGLVALLSKRQGEALKAAHMRLARAAWRMGLVDVPK